MNLLGQDRFYEEVARSWDDEKLLKKLAVKRPSWDCGEHLWRIWKKALREEALRRGLLG